MEHDSIGALNVPAEAYYGVQSMRAATNFQITHRPLHPVLIDSIVMVKKAAAITNEKSGKLDQQIAQAIIQACDEILDGNLRDQFIVDAIQGGAGTSANMNANEVIANRAIEILGGTKGDYSVVHPNDHVNMSQSTNDVIPTAGKITVLKLLPQTIKELEKLEKAMEEKEAEFDDILKMGRTQLQDAVPMRLGQSFGAFAHVLKRDIKRLKNVMDEMKVLNIGATAIGTAINVDPYYLANISYELSKVAGISLKQADDLIDATQNLDGFVSVSGVLKTCAVDISKISNDLRLMSSGPRTGLSEINLPARQNGSSIMPGKINPVIPEVVSQVAYLIIGHDYTITMAAEAGQCEEYIEKSVGISTALCPYIGYAKSAEIAKKSLKTGISVKELVVRRRSVKGRRIKRDLKTRENDTAYERKSDESSIINTIRIQKRMKSKKRLWRNSELLLLQYPLAQDIIHK